jgi:hypothetical protein
MLRLLRVVLTRPRAWAWSALTLQLCCSTVPRPNGRPADPPGMVGPVPMADLAREVARLELQGHTSRPLTPFLIVDHPLKVPTAAARLACTWGTQPLPVVHFVPSGTQASKREPWPQANWAQIDSVTRVDFDGHLSPAHSWNVVQWGPVRTYHVASVCEDGPRAAILVEFIDGPLDGSGFIVVFEFSDRTWKVMAKQTSWVS